MTRGLAKLLNFFGYLVIPLGWLLYTAGWLFPEELHSAKFIVVAVAPFLIWVFFWSFVVDRKYLSKYINL